MLGCALPFTTLSKLCKMLGQNHFAEPDRHVLTSTRSSCNVVRNALFCGIKIVCVLWNQKFLCVSWDQICMYYLKSERARERERERERERGFGSAQECGSLQQQIVEKREEESDLLLKQCVEVLHFSQIVEKRTA